MSKNNKKILKMDSIRSEALKELEELEISKIKEFLDNERKKFVESWVILLALILFSITRGWATVKELSYVGKCSDNRVRSYLKVLREKSIVHEKDPIKKARKVEREEIVTYRLPRVGAPKNEESHILSTPIKRYFVPLDTMELFNRMDQEDTVRKDISDYVDSTGVIPAESIKELMQILMNKFIDEDMIGITAQVVTKAAKGVLEVLEVYSSKIADDWKAYLENMARFADYEAEMSKRLKKNVPQLVKTIDDMSDDEIKELFKKILTGEGETHKS